MKILMKPLAVLLLTFSSMVASAADIYYYSIEGEIAELNNKAIRLVDAAYPLMPTLKVLNVAGTPISASSLSKGDYVKITILNMDKQRRVDTIQKVVKPKL